MILGIPQITSAREIQRNYRKLFDQVKKTKKPLIVMRNSKPDVVVFDYKKLEEIEAIIAVLQSREEIRQGKGKVLKSITDLWYEGQKS